MRDVILLFFLLIILYFFLCLSLFTFRHHTHVLMTRAQTYMDRRDALYSNAEGALRAFCWGYTGTHRFFRLINLLCSKRRTFFRSSLSTYIYIIFFEHFHSDTSFLAHEDFNPFSAFRSLEKRMQLSKIEKIRCEGRKRVAITGLPLGSVHARHFLRVPWYGTW